MNEYTAWNAETGVFEVKRVHWIDSTIPEISNGYLLDYYRREVMRSMPEQIAIAVSKAVYQGLATIKGENPTAAQVRAQSEETMETIFSRFDDEEYALRFFDTIEQWAERANNGTGRGRPRKVEA